jgi:hypothetical protein
MVGGQHNRAIEELKKHTGPANKGIAHVMEGLSSEN